MISKHIDDVRAAEVKVREAIRVLDDALLRVYYDSTPDSKARVWANVASSDLGTMLSDLSRFHFALEESARYLTTETT